MKRVLIVIQDMESGGGQKSLLSFLKCLEKSDKSKEYYIELLVAKPTGIFYSQIPASIHVLMTPKELLWLGTPLGDKVLKGKFCLKGYLGKARWILGKRLGIFSTTLNEEQRLWKSWKKLIPINKTKYDIAISYMNGFPNYYVMDKVYAKSKILWIHNEYQKLNYSAEFDRPYYEACNRIVTISEKCLESFTSVFPHLKNKIFVLENITINGDIIALGDEGTAKEFEYFDELKLLSIGRLCEQKGFDMAIMAASILKNRGMNFIWLILGEGPDRERLQTQINENGLANYIKMIGIRENPYVYIKECDIFVQTSRFEGKSIVLDEAKVFCKPIVVTNYPTVGDSIRSGENGLVVEMNEKAIADGIEELSKNKTMVDHFVLGLKTVGGNEDELAKYINIMLNI